MKPLGLALFALVFCGHIMAQTLQKDSPLKAEEGFMPKLNAALSIGVGGVHLAGYALEAKIHDLHLRGMYGLNTWGFALQWHFKSIDNQKFMLNRWGAVRTDLVLSFQNNNSHQADFETKSNSNQLAISQRLYSFLGGFRSYFNRQMAVSLKLGLMHQSRTISYPKQHRLHPQVFGDNGVLLDVDVADRRSFLYGEVSTQFYLRKWSN